jgi:hypothetical protein
LYEELTLDNWNIFLTFKTCRRQQSFSIRISPAGPRLKQINRIHSEYKLYSPLLEDFLAGIEKFLCPPSLKCHCLLERQSEEPATGLTFAADSVSQFGASGDRLILIEITPQTTIFD